MHDTVAVLYDARYTHEPLTYNGHSVLVVEFGETITFELPVSSSKVRKITPFAVPGRCRTMTCPPTVAALQQVGASFGSG
jgi:hypothetical protein